ncbi:FAD-dependent monooxygenase [Nesterenkonia pannonica]|uniref:FAD-dependent oxidoreductase n=1 Tax=Nesterenkonia pannonica TaxID=1548602 RepID=UPI002164AD2C|nr:FAD-dependent monooxygenase [Nesterenkonia pannonica]
MVIGAGPVGLLLSAELQRLGVDVHLLEQRPTPGPGSRAIGIHPPTLSAMEPSGVTEQLLQHALRVRTGEARAVLLLGTVQFDALKRRFPFVATLPQETTEAVLGAAAPRLSAERPCSS